MATQTPLLTVIRAIVRAAGMEEQFDTADDFYLRVEHESYMPLVIEKHRTGMSIRPEHAHDISITHYREEYGDLVADPEILMANTGELLFIQMPNYFAPIRFQDACGALMVAPGRDADTRSFARTWARTIREQGFIEAARRQKVQVE